MARRLAVIMALLSMLAGVLPVGSWWGGANEPAAATSGCCDEGCTCCLPGNREPACPCRPERESNPVSSIGPAIVQQRGGAKFAARFIARPRTNGPAIRTNRIDWRIVPTSEAGGGVDSVRIQALHCVWVV